jgi:hypothetical protein
MTLRKKFNSARKILTTLQNREHVELYRICNDIRIAENALVEVSQPLLTRCMQHCKGLCCRNLDLDGVIGMYDFIYLLTVAPDLQETIVGCLEKESLFTQDCIFLKSGVGPCLFPFDCRPEKCLTTFCDDDGPAGNQIRYVGENFDRLCRFIRFRTFRRLREIFHDRFRFLGDDRP